MASYHTHQDLADVVYRRLAVGVPPVNVITPPHAGDGKPPACGHCGTVLPAGQHPRAFAVEGFEDATHVHSGAPLRLQVYHCDACLDGPGCDADARAPQGHRIGGGFCHTTTEEA